MNDPFARMKRLVGFGVEDEANLVELAPLFVAAGPRMVRSFYDFTDDPEISEVIDGWRIQLDQLMTSWFTHLFAGDYTPACLQRSARVGAVHARIGLPQQLIEGRMSVLRVLGAQVILEHAPSRARALEQQRSLLRIIDLHMMTINQVYEEERIGTLSGKREVVLQRLVELGPPVRMQLSA